MNPGGTSFFHKAMLFVALTGSNALAARSQLQQEDRLVAVLSRLPKGIVDSSPGFIPSIIQRLRVIPSGSTNQYIQDKPSFELGRPERRVRRQLIRPCVMAKLLRSS